MPTSEGKITCEELIKDLQDNCYDPKARVRIFTGIGQPAGIISMYMDDDNSLCIDIIPLDKWDDE